MKQDRGKSFALYRVFLTRKDLFVYLLQICETKLITKYLYENDKIEICFKNYSIFIRDGKLYIISFFILLQNEVLHTSIFFQNYIYSIVKATEKYILKI